MADLKKSIKVGIIAEDNSDVESFRILLRKINPARVFSIKRFVGNGSGKIKRKCKDWAVQLKRMGCQCLLVVHDLDRKDVIKLRYELVTAINPSPINDHIILIPSEELEAWLLCDAKALRYVFSLKRLPNVPSNPEQIRDPKGYLRDLIWRLSNKTRHYINTVHNPQIIEQAEVKSLRRCSEFKKLEGYWMLDR